jgi:hypothetical protein
MLAQATRRGNVGQGFKASTQPKVTSRQTTQRGPVDLLFGQVHIVREPDQDAYPDIAAKGKRGALRSVDAGTITTGQSTSSTC